MIFQLLAGIVIAAVVFAALLWSIYRAVQSRGKERAVYVILALSTLLVVTAFSYDLLGLLLTSGFTCLGAALYGIVLDRGLNKLLPFVQLLLGALAAWSSIATAMP